MNAHIHNEWAIIERSTIPPQVGYDQRRDLKLFFYMGAEAMFRILMQRPPVEDPEELAQLNSDLHTELTQFVGEFLQMRSQGDG